MCIFFRYALFDVVTLKAPIDRPWKQPVKETTYGRFDVYFANFSAPSIDSVPLFAKKKLSSLGGRIFCNSAANIKLDSYIITTE